jgi:hypothetical protein
VGYTTPPVYYSLDRWEPFRLVPNRPGSVNMAVDRAPVGLTPRSKALWRAVVGEFELSAAELEILLNALKCSDRADEAAKALAHDGLVMTDRYGSAKAHPMIDVESRNRALFARFIAQLGVKATIETVRRSGAKPGPRPQRRPLRGVG